MEQLQKLSKVGMFWSRKGAYFEEEIKTKLSPNTVDLVVPLLVIDIIDIFCSLPPPLTTSLSLSIYIYIYVRVCV